MKEKEHKINISVKITVTDDGKKDETKKLGAFYRLPWGCSCLISIILFFLNVEYGKSLMGIQGRDSLAVVLVWTIFFTFCCFILKIVKKSEKEGSCIGCDYPYFGF